MDKRLNTCLLVLAGLVIIAGAGLYVLRHSLLEAFINIHLHKQGIPVQSISARDVSFKAFLLQDLVAGTDKELRVDKILVSWNLTDLLAGKPVSIEISGLQLALDLSGERPLLGSLPPVISSAGEGAGTLSWLSALALRDSTIHLHSAAGDFTMTLSGGIDQDQRGAQKIHFSTIISGPSGQTRGMLAATLDTQGNMQGKITVSEGMLNLPEAKISSFSGEAIFVFAAMRPIDGSSDAGTGKLDLQVDGGQLTTGPLNIQRVFVSLPMQINLDQDTWRIALRSPGQIKLGKIDPMDTLSFPDSPGFSISQADFEWVKHPQGQALKHRIVAVPENFTVLAEQEKSAVAEAQIHPGKITLSGGLDANEKYQGQFAISDVVLTLPQSHIQLKNISANLYLGAAKTDKVADFAIGQLQHLAPAPFFKALSFAGSIKKKSVDGKPVVYSLNATGGVPGSRYLKFSGKHTFDSGNGMLKVEIAPLSFSPDSLQPAALSPVLAPLEDVNGLVSASAQIQWCKQGISGGRGVVDLQNVSFTHEAAKVNGLNATLNLSNLLPLNSRPQQIVTIRNIDPGIPLENLLVSYQIEGTDPPRIALEKAHFSMMDGLLSLEPTVIDPASVRSNLMIRVDGIDLADFFELIQIEGLTGSGHLNGHIPITVEDNQITIKNSHLAAKAPGILRFKSEKAAQLLADAGEEMNLLLQAVQDFHYTELSLNLDKSATHDLIAKLSLLGNNPNVKDGQIFRLNIKLESNIDKILQPIHQGYSLSNEILRGSFRLR
ncbi:MAG: YdbH domain-containing protein [Pseudomonadota bacterium]